MFPAGLRVLVVDDDLAWLKILEKMLKKCSYEVTTCTLAREALKLLRERKDGFDIVISDVNMPDMDGFKLLEHVGLEMDLPVIMMSVDGETSRVMKGVQHGACDYLLKPIRMKELKNIWQHVMRKRMHDVREIEGFENGTDHNNGHYGGDQTSLKKRKDIDNKYDEKGSSDPSSTKKARVVWTVELHQKFVKAVNQIGIDSDKVGPKKILDLMDVPWLTRENVASHLQKYRLYLSRIRKEGETENSAGGMKSTDHSPKESTGSFSLPDSNCAQQNDVSSNYKHPGNQLPIKPLDSKLIDADLESINVLPLTVQRKPFNGEIDPDKASDLQAGLNHSLEPLETSINYVQFDSSVANRYSWTAQAQEMHLKPEFKPDSRQEDCFKFDQPPGSVMQQHVQADFLELPPGITPEPSISETSNLTLIDAKAVSGKVGGSDVRQLSPIERALLSFCALDPEPSGSVFDMKHQNFNHESGAMKEEEPLQSSIQSFHLYPKSHIPNSQCPGPDYLTALDMKSQILFQGGIIDQSSIFGLESTCGLTMGLPRGDLTSFWLPNDGGTCKDLGFDYVFSDFKFADHISEASAAPCAPKFGLDYDHPFDFVEYPADQGLAWV